MDQAGYLETRGHFSPTSLTLIIALHAAAITAAMAWKMDVIDRWTPTKSKIFTVPAEPPKQEPRKEPEPQRQQPSVVKRIEPIVETTPAREPIDLTLIERPTITEILDPPLRPVDPTPPRVLQAARATGDVRKLISPDDYPESARRNEQTGTVQARLEIGANGKVTGCSIVTSSGSAALDSATCRVLKSRARFTPAKDSSGQPVSDSYTTPKIVWRIEGNG